MPSQDSCVNRAKAFLGGEALSYAAARALYRQCLSEDHVAQARAVVARLRSDQSALLDALPDAIDERDRLCTDEALLTSKDAEIAASLRHDRALSLLRAHFGGLDDPRLDSRVELMGVAGGICKRRWQDLGQLADLKRAATFYERGARHALGDDSYCHINAAFLDDLLASLGEDATPRSERARTLRERIVTGLPALASVGPDSRWWNAASRAEALFGLGRYGEATAAVRAADDARPAPWELQSTVRQLAHLAHLQHRDPMSDPDVFAFFDALVPGGAANVLRAVLGRVGLALSGGGFRASFYHLGVLARLAELDALRHVSVLSCVSGGSIVGACYWMMLRERLQEQETLTRDDYIAIVKALIDHFDVAVQANLRGLVQPSRAGVVWRLLKDERGALDPERAADGLDAYFYRPLALRLGLDPRAPLRMSDLAFDPMGYVPRNAEDRFQPGRCNWLRSDKVPVLVLNATTVNTGHGWQFTPTWMGESPWAVHEAADSIPRLEWAWYDDAHWQVGLARAVAASACVPGVFAPLRIREAYADVDVRLVDGGVHDNQGTVALLAQDCNIVLVSDACGQLMFEADDVDGLRGLVAYGKRAMGMLMERVRLANFADLQVRREVGRLGGLMFLHMKAGLDAAVVRRIDSQSSYEIRRTVHSPSGVRKDFQKALSELRTDLDVFTTDEQHALMACGYQMATKACERDLAKIEGLLAAPPATAPGWNFDAMRVEITSTAEDTPRRKPLLEAFAKGASITAV